MNALTCPKQTTKAWLDHAIRAACDGIAPSWPLDCLIAVNPYWQHTHSPFAEVAANLAQLAGSPMTLPLSYYRTRWQNGQSSRSTWRAPSRNRVATSRWRPCWPPCSRRIKRR